MSHPRPKVSIGIPVNNGERYLEDALDSILAQTFTDFELIIADNASNDRTREISLRYARQDPRIYYHRIDKNIGAAPNHNLLFKLAKGEYFKWAAYDDRIAPDFLAKCVQVLDQYPDVVACMPLTTRIDEYGNHAGTHQLIAGADHPDRTKRFRSFALHNRSGNFVYGLMRTSAIARTFLHGSFPSSDLVFLAELALYGRYYVLPEYLFFRRSHPRQSTKGTLSKEWARSLWFDASLKGKIILPKWKSLIAYLHVINTAPLSRQEKITCLFTLFLWTLLPHNRRGLVKDVIRAILKFAARFPRKIKFLFREQVDTANR